MARQRRFERIYDDVEPVEEYRPGGYHPVLLRDILNSRYEVIRKLAYGQFSTVWLTRDLKNSFYVAVKILKAEASILEGPTELSILEAIRANALSYPGAQHVVQILDSFNHEGPNGTHLCLVFPVMGGDAQAHARLLPERRYPLAVSKTLSKQVTQGLQFLHGCDIVHGDLQPGNIVFAVSAADIDEALSKPGTTPCDVRWKNGVKSDQSAPKHLYVPEPIIDCSLISGQPGHKVMVAITDLGGAVWHGKATSRLPRVPRALRAPELISGRSNVSDIFELVCGEPLFCLSTFGLSTKQIDEEHQQMVEDIVKPALDQEAAIFEFATYLHMRTHGRLGDDVLPLAKLLRHSMLVEPEHRKDALELLSDPWFNAI
ncbi:hypothetical protein KXV69_003089 [Aspergillus fumigatus]|nr:hypothetical protein KXV69_003089 [Aspergillus fumigatus]KAH3127926.1 hypothetical protein KXV82_003832 [Aspergillus fumigatus]